MQQYLLHRHYGQLLLFRFCSTCSIKWKHRLLKYLRLSCILRKWYDKLVQHNLRSSVGYYDDEFGVTCSISVRYLYFRNYPKEQLQLRFDLWVDQLDNCQLHFDHGLRDDFRFNQLSIQDLPQFECLHLLQHLRCHNFWQHLLSFYSSTSPLSRKRSMLEQLLQ